MKETALLTDVELRAHWFQTQQDSITVAEGTRVTQTALEFLKEQGIALRFAAVQAEATAMTVTPLPDGRGAPRYREEATGNALAEKAEHMTHLRGNRLVPKNHPRIAFRGKLDTLMAEMLSAQLLAQETGGQALLTALEELLAFARSILGAEVKEEPLEPICLFGMDSAALRDVSHHIQRELGIPHPVPSYHMGRVCVALNRLRTQIREVELSAVQAFVRGERVERSDILEGLNRLSSCVYILFCREVAGSNSEVK